MKFCKRYQQYMEGREKEFPIVNLKKMKKTLKSCRSICGSQFSNHEQDLVQGAKEKGVLVGDSGAVKSCPDQCQVCDGTFFPTLLKEMSSVVGCFNKRAQELLELHFSSGFRKYIMWIKGKTRHHHKSLIQEGKELVTYAIINTIAMRKILKKYDKIHYSKQGQTFRSQAQIMHIEILHSPWLCELMALYINNKEGKDIPGTIPGLFEDCKLDFDVDKPVLSCGLFDSLKLNIDLTCSICLDTVFDPISLSCGHIFCYICACSAASVTIVDGLKSADPRAKCPLCRQTEVFNGYVRLAELNILLSEKCPEYWEKRLQDERIDRIRRAKEHWDSQCRALLGI